MVKIKAARRRGICDTGAHTKGTFDRAEENAKPIWKAVLYMEQGNILQTEAHHSIFQTYSQQGLEDRTRK